MEKKSNMRSNKTQPAEGENLSYLSGGGGERESYLSWERKMSRGLSGLGVADIDRLSAADHARMLAQENIGFHDGAIRSSSKGMSLHGDANRSDEARRARGFQQTSEAIPFTRSSSTEEFATGSGRLSAARGAQLDGATSSRQLEPMKLPLGGSLEAGPCVAGTTNKAFFPDAPPPSAFAHSAMMYTQRRSGGSLTPKGNRSDHSTPEREHTVLRSIMGGTGINENKGGDNGGSEAVPRFLDKIRSWMRFQWYHWFFLMLIVFILTLSVIYSSFGDYDVFEADVNRNWGFLLQEERAAVWLNEFGVGNPDRWWSNMMRYINENGVDFGYWSIDGQKEPGKVESFGLLEYHYDEYRKVAKLYDLSPGVSVYQRGGIYYVKAVVEYNERNGLPPPWGFGD
ncbi:unnamed protein product [Amoebophrya sp. A25]|nr:unnamed protein product [Amoebophrya sp. A25]|eukprot:GSA25T00011696001.1